MVDAKKFAGNLIAAWRKGKITYSQGVTHCANIELVDTGAEAFRLFKAGTIKATK